MSLTAFKYRTELGPGGLLKLDVSLPEGTQVEVLILTHQPDNFEDLVEAAQSSLGFWDNPMDDEDWNNG